MEIPFQEPNTVQTAHAAKMQARVMAAPSEFGVERVVEAG
jgi:hypothetical protein